MRGIGLTNTGDIDLSSGDIQLSDVTDFHKKHILLAKTGDFKHAPTIGVQVRNFINSNKRETLLRRIRKNFLKVGINVVNLSLNAQTGILTETGRYEEG